MEAAVQKAVPASSIKTEEKHKTEEKVRTEDKLQDGKKAKPRVLPAGNAVVQLGAYRSEDELYEAWNKMQVKFDDLSYREPTVIRADLGAKGIYYRLRIAGIANAAEAKTLCATLSAKGQACILISDK